MQGCPDGGVVGGGGGGGAIRSPHKFFHTVKFRVVPERMGNPPFKSSAKHLVVLHNMGGLVVSA